MKSLPQHLNEKLVIFPSQVDEKLVIFPSQVDEKLVINKNFKSSDILDEIKNVEWKEVQYAGKNTEDIRVFDKFVTYIRETKQKEISCANAARLVNKDKYICGINIDKKIIVLYHKSDVEHDLFEKIGICLVTCRPEIIQFTHSVGVFKLGIAPLNTRSTFFSSGKYYQYEISKETFKAIESLYEEL